MNDDLVRDRETSFAYLNAARSCYEGKFASLNIAAQMQVASVQASEISTLKEDIKKIVVLVKQLYAGECLFSYKSTTADSFEAQNIVALLQRYKAEVSELADETTRILTVTSLPTDSDVSFLIANIIRNSYSRDTYARGLLEYTKLFANQNAAKQYEAMIHSTSDLIKASQEAFNRFRDAGLSIAVMTQPQIQQLHLLGFELPTMFKIQQHELAQLLSRFNGGLTFQNLDFTKEEAQAWNGAGCNPVIAGYWRIYNFGPEEALAWATNRFSEPGFASQWRSAGFTPDAAVPWAQAGFPPFYAAQWARAGMDPERAKAAIDSGQKQPPTAV